MTTSAWCSALASDGFNVKLCGEAAPSMSRRGVATPSITAAASEWMGFSVTTTSRSFAAAGMAPGRIAAVHAATQASRPLRNR